jgi:hypothetical protein
MRKVVSRRGLLEPTEDSAKPTRRTKPKIEGEWDQFIQQSNKANSRGRWVTDILYDAPN